MATIAKMMVELGADVSSLRHEMNSGVIHLGRFVDQAEKVGGAMRSIGTQMTMSITLPLAAMGAGAVLAANSIELAMIGVAKTVDATAEEIAAMQDEFVRMSEEMPHSATELAGVAEAAGQLGVAKGDIVDFTQTMADLGVSTNLAADDAAVALARLANITGMSLSEVDRMGSTIVALGNAGASTEAEITEMALRIAGAGAQVGLAESEILGFANALSSVGIEAEAGGTAISKLFIDMASAADEGGEQLERFAAVAGTTAEDFAARFEEDAAGAMIAFMAGLGRVEEAGGSLFATLREMGFEEVRVRDALLRASGAADQFAASIETGNAAWAENTALTEEASKFYAANANQLKAMWNMIKNVSAELGATMMPVVSALVDAFRGFLAVLRPVIEGFGMLPTPIRAVAIAAVAAVAALGPLLIAIGGMVTMLPLAIPHVAALGAALLTFAANPVVLAIAGIVALIGILGMLHEEMDTVERQAPSTGSALLDAANAGHEGAQKLADEWDVVGQELRDVERISREVDATLAEMAEKSEERLAFMRRRAIGGSMGGLTAPGAAGINIPSGRAPTFDIGASREDAESVASVRRDMEAAARASATAAQSFGIYIERGLFTFTELRDRVEETEEALRSIRQARALATTEEEAERATEQIGALQMQLTALGDAMRREESRLVASFDAVITPVEQMEQAFIVNMSAHDRMVNNIIRRNQQAEESTQKLVEQLTAMGISFDALPDVAIAPPPQTEHEHVRAMIAAAQAAGESFTDLDAQTQALFQAWSEHESKIQRSWAEGMSGGGFLQDIGSSLVDSLQSVGGMIMSALNPLNLFAAVIDEMARNLAPTLEALAEPLGRLAAIVAEALAPILEALIPIIEALMPVFQAVLQVLTPIVMAMIPILEALVPIIEAMFPIFKFLAIVTTYVIEAFGHIVAPILDAVGLLVRGIGWAIRAIGRAIDSIPGISARGLINAGQSAIDMGHALGDMADSMREMAESMDDARDEINAVEIDHANDGLNDLGDTARQVANALRNVPAGYRIALARFESTDISNRDTGLGGGGGGDTGTGGGGKFPQAASVTVESGGIVIHAAAGQDATEIAYAVVNELRRKSLAQFGTTQKWSEVAL